MKAESKEPKKKKIAIVSGLKSGEERKVFSALEQIVEHGDETMVVPLIELYRDSPSEEVRARVQGLLSSLKISGAEDILIETLGDEAYQTVHGDILGFIWNSGFHPIDAVDVITKVSLSGDYMTAVEGLTLLENINGTLDEESLYQALLEVRGFLETHKDDGHELYALALSIFEVLAKHEKE